MIVTEKKPFQELLVSLGGLNKVFLVGCGECATTCKTGGSAQIDELKRLLEAESKTIVGSCLPSAPCIAAQVKKGLAIHMQELRQADCVLVLACGLGVQSVKENLRLDKEVLPALNTICSAVVDAAGNFFEKCSMCADCLLGITCGICPLTLCPKGLLNGPCGGMDKGRCEVDKERDCAWVLIYKEMEKRRNVQALKQIVAPKDFQKCIKPHRIIG